MENAVLMDFHAFQGRAFKTHHVAPQVVLGSVNPALDILYPVSICHQLPHAKTQLSGIQETVQSD